MDSLAIFNKGAVVTREAIHRFEAELFKLPTQITLRVDHHFTRGVYVRTMYIPGGVALAGHIHRFPCISIVQKGDIIVATEQHGAVRLKAPTTLETPAGIKRVGYAIEDTIFTTVHANPTDDKDVERLEAFLIAPDYTLLENEQCLSQPLPQL